MIPKDLKFGECLEWAQRYEAVRQWLPHLQNKKQNAYYLWRFCKWADKTPDELFKIRTENNSGHKMEKLLDRFVADESLKNSVRVCASNAVKSFFKWNYEDLPDKSGQITQMKQKPYRNPTKDVLRRLQAVCYNPRDRALVSFVNNTAIALETLACIQWLHFEEDWETQETPHISVPDKFLKGHGIGKWKGVRQETFLTPQAKRDLIFYRDWLRRKGAVITRESHVWLQVEEPFASLDKVGIKGAFFDLAKRAGVKFSAHDGRRYVQTALEHPDVGMPPNWIQKIKGRKVRGEHAPYSQPAIEKLREVYRKAVPILEFSHGGEQLEELHGMVSSTTLLLQKQNEEIERLKQHRVEQEERIQKLENTLKLALKKIEEATSSHRL